MSFLLTGNQKSRVKLDREVPSTLFGNAPNGSLGTKDFILCTAVQNNAVILTQKIPIDGEVGTTYTLNLAEEVNSKGITGGNVTLEYDYLRSVAGSYKSFYVDEDAQLYFGNVVESYGRLYKDTVSPSNDALGSAEQINEFLIQNESELLLQKRFTYEIAGISPNRKEVKIRLKDGLEDNTLYRDQFNNFKSDVADTLNYNSIEDISYVGSDDSSIIYGRDNKMLGSPLFIDFINRANANEYKIVANIPEFFVTSEKEVQVTTVSTEFFQEPEPSFIPTMQQSQESEYGQWTYYTDYTGTNNSGWRVVGEAFDEYGNYILSNALTNGMPLNVAADLTELQNIDASAVESLIPEQPLAVDNPMANGELYGAVRPYVANLDDESGGPVYYSMSFSTAWHNWFSTYVAGKFHHPEYGSFMPRSGESGEGSLFAYIVEKCGLTTVTTGYVNQIGGALEVHVYYEVLSNILTV